MILAFFGLDNSLSWRSVLLWRSAPGKDGMPLVFSYEIDPTTVDLSDFRITTKKDENFYSPHSLEQFELRTILLIGQFGDHPYNEVTIVDELKKQGWTKFSSDKKEQTRYIFFTVR